MRRDKISLTFQSLSAFMLLSLVFVGCTNNNTPRFNGDPGSLGYCGQPGKAYEIPISNNYNMDKFEELETLEEDVYKASSLSLFVKEDASLDETPQVLATHFPVFTNDDFVSTSFAKNCARDLKIDSSNSFNLVLPIKVSMNADGTWTADETATYTIEYDKSISKFLNLETSLNPQANAAQGDSAVYMETLILKRKDESSEKQSDDIFIQIQISDNPAVFARISVSKQTSEK